MKTSAILIGCAPILVSGCATFAELPEAPRVNPADILSNVECELARTFADLNAFYRKTYNEDHWLQYWATNIVLDLYARDTTSGGASVGLAFPLDPGQFGFGLGGGGSHEYEGQGTLKYSLYFDDLQVCAPRPYAPVLTGETGAGAWVKRAVLAMDATGNYPLEIVYSITFTIVANVNGAPGFTLLPVGDGTIGAGFSLTHEQKDRHTLTLTLAQIDPKLLVAETKGAPVKRAGAPRAASPAAEHRPVDPRTQQNLDEAETLFLLRQLDQELDDE